MCIQGGRMMGNYNLLFSPIKIGDMVLKNRIALTPMSTRFGDKDGKATEELIQYYLNYAKGGVGFITMEALDIDNTHMYGMGILRITDDSFIEGFKKMTDACHGYGAKVAAQLIQGGPFASSKITGLRPLSASPIPHVWNRADTPREMTHADIADYTAKYVAAALRIKDAGFDAIEIHAAHAHALLGAFLSPLTNRRTDEYGGDVHGRARFLIEIIQAFKNELGSDFPLGVRLSAGDAEQGGQTVIETAYLAQLLEQAGVNYIHLSYGTVRKSARVFPSAGTDRALNMPYSKLIKESVGIPVGLVGRIKEPWIAETLLRQGYADYVYMGRQLICDPDFPNKCQSGSFEHVRPCIGCLACLDLQGKMYCTLNPGVGNYKAYEIEEASEKKKVLVVGGGPGGIEAAATAAKRGHDVSLLEKSEKLGGQFIIAGYPEYKQDMACALKYLINELKKANAKIVLNKEAGVETIKEIKPDEVIVATGGEPIMPKWLEESGHPNIMTAWDALKNCKPIGRNILVIGGGAIGCETADFLAEHYKNRPLYGRKITIIEMLDNIDTEELTSNRDFLIERLARKDIDIITGAKVERVTAEEVYYSKDGGQGCLKGFDTIIAAMGTRPDNALAEELKELNMTLHVIGDAKQARKIRNAITEAREIGRTI